MVQEIKAWQQVVQPKIEEAIVRERKLRPHLAELVAHKRESVLVLKAFKSQHEDSIKPRGSRRFAFGDPAILDALTGLCCGTLLLFLDPGISASMSRKRP